MKLGGELGKKKGGAKVYEWGCNTKGVTGRHGNADRRRLSGVCRAKQADLDRHGTQRRRRCQTVLRQDRQVRSFKDEKGVRAIL